MVHFAEAVFENGLFRPLTNVRLPERQRVRIAYVPSGEAISIDDLPVSAFAVLAEQSPAYEFLADPQEDLYSLADGEPIS
jgi:hypothetical protein